MFMWALGLSVCVSASFLVRCIPVPALASPAEVLDRLLWSLARLLAWPLAVFPVGFFRGSCWPPPVSSSVVSCLSPLSLAALPVGVLVSLSLWALGISVVVSASFLDRCLSVPALAFPAVVLERLLWSLARLPAWPLAVFPVGVFRGSWCPPPVSSFVVFCLSALPLAAFPVGFLVLLSLWALGF